jgi:hypothetical protein
VRNPFEILGLDWRSATPADVKAAFHRLAKQHHPDAGGDAEVFKEISQAYAILRDPDRLAAIRAEIERALTPHPVFVVTFTTATSATNGTGWTTTTWG